MDKRKQLQQQCHARTQLVGTQAVIRVDDRMYAHTQCAKRDIQCLGIRQGAITK
jgi:hypothetical protein